MSDNWLRAVGVLIALAVLLAASLLFGRLAAPPLDAPRPAPMEATR